MTEKERKELKALAEALKKCGFCGVSVNKVYGRTEKGNATKAKTTKVVFDWTAPKKFDKDGFKAFRNEVTEKYGIKYQKAIRNPKHRSEYIQSGLWLFDYVEGWEKLAEELNKTLQPKAAKATAVAEANPFAKYLSK